MQQLARCQFKQLRTFFQKFFEQCLTHYSYLQNIIFSIMFRNQYFYRDTLNSPLPLYSKQSLILFTPPPPQHFPSYTLTLLLLFLTRHLISGCIQTHLHQTTSQTTLTPPPECFTGAQEKRFRLGSWAPKSELQGRRRQSF